MQRESTRSARGRRPPVGELLLGICLAAALLLAVAARLGATLLAPADTERGLAALAAQPPLGSSPVGPARP